MEDQTSLNLSNKNITDDANIFKEIISSYPNILSLDLSDNQLTFLPEDLSLLSKLQFLDIQRNSFIDFNKLVDALTTLPSLVNLNINLKDQEQVELIFQKLPNLEVLNEKKIKGQNDDENNLNINSNNNLNNNTDENSGENDGMENNDLNDNNNENNENGILIDINDDEIKNISLQNEIPNFNNIYKKISEKFKEIKKNNDFKDEFQNLIKNEINKINSNYDSNTPNYIYSSNVIESQLSIYSFFTQKFLEFLQIKKEKDTFDLIKEIHDNIYKSYMMLIKIIYRLYPIVEEKIQMMRIQLNEAIKHNNNVFAEIDENENKIREDNKNKEKIINSYQDKINYLESRIKQLENENNLMSEKLYSSVKNMMNSSSEKQYQIISPNQTNNFINNNININNINNNSINNIPFLRSEKKNLPENYNNINFNYKNYYENMNNSYNNTFLQATPVCNRVFTIKMMKEIINDIYNSKAEFDKKSDENKLPRETMEQHMYTYLNQKYGLKSIIIEWASNIINGIKIFSSEDSEICLFGKILRNEIEEDARLIFSDVQKSIIEYLKYYIKRKNHYISANEISQIIKEKKRGSLAEEEWKEVINYLYNEEHAKILEKRISDLIQKKYYKSKLDTDRKLTREEIIQLSKLKEEHNIPFKDLVKILHEFQIKQREKQLKNFVQMFKRVDKDNNGIINEEEFVSLLYNMNIFGDQLKQKIVELLTQIDPYNNKQITFSECVNLFQSIPYEPEGNININNNQNNPQGNNMSLLDRICMG
jgi:hypothetical protein